MKFSTLLQLIGSGSVLIVVGVFLFVMGLAYGFATATELPLWATLTGFGLFAGIVGIALVDRGSEEAGEEVKKLPVIDALRSPFWVLGASIFGGFLLARMTRKRPIIVEHATVEQLENEPATAEAVTPPEKPAEFSLSQLVGDQLRELGAAAAGMAISFGIKSLGIPPIKQLLGEMLGGQDDQNAPGATGDQSRTGAADNSARSRGYAMQRNGAVHQDDYDPMFGL